MSIFDDFSNPTYCCSRKSPTKWLSNSLNAERNKYLRPLFKTFMSNAESNLLPPPAYAYPPLPYQI